MHKIISVILIISAGLISHSFGQAKMGISQDTLSDNFPRRNGLIEFEKTVNDAYSKDDNFSKSKLWLSQIVNKKIDNEDRQGGFMINKGYFDIGENQKLFFKIKITCLDSSSTISISEISIYSTDPTFHTETTSTLEDHIAYAIHLSNVYKNAKKRQRYVYEENLNYALYQQYIEGIISSFEKI